MLRINTSTKKRNLIWLALPASMLLHLAFIVSTAGWTKTQQTNYGSSKIEFKVKTPEPPKVVDLPKPVQKPKPVPTKTVIKPKRKAPPPKAQAPKANTEQPPAQEPTDAPAKPVFGVTADSVVADGGGVAVRVGNTLQKSMEHKFTEPMQVSALPAAPTRRKPPKPVPNYTLTRSPSFELKVEPVYPEGERDRGVEGTVQLEVLIDARGAVRKVRVLKTPSRALAQAAVMALRKSRFAPGYVDLTPVAVKLKIPYRFVLNG